MTINHHNPIQPNDPLGSAIVNIPLGNIDEAIDNIINGLTNLHISMTNFTDATHDHSDVENGGEVSARAFDTTGASVGDVMQVRSVKSGWKALTDLPEWETGSIVMSGADSHEGWLICNGSPVSRTEFEDLFDAIGLTYGSGDGATTFNVPQFHYRDFSANTRTNRMPVMQRGSSGDYAVSMGEIGGLSEFTLSVAHLPSHTHQAKRFGTSETPGVPDNLFRPSQYVGRKDSGGSASGTTTETEGDNREPRPKGEAHNNMPPYTVFNFFIKT